MNLLRKYKRLGLTDSALEMYREELSSINEQYGLSDTEKENAIKSAYDRLEKKSVVKNIDRRKNSGFNKAIKTYLRRHPSDTLQDYIDRIEDINNFKDINDFTSTLDSNQIREIYETGRGTGMTDEEIENETRRLYNEYLETGSTYEQIFDLLLSDLAKEKK